MLKHKIIAGLAVNSPVAKKSNVPNRKITNYLSFPRTQSDIGRLEFYQHSLQASWPAGLGGKD